MSFLNTILDLIFPVNCISCGQRGSDLCPNCLAEAPEALRESEDWIFPFYDYRHPNIKKAVWMLKYNGKKRLAGVFGEVIYNRILEELSDLSQMENFLDPILVPIPLSDKRLRERGFNQAEMICKKLMKLDAGNNFELENKVLIKIKETEHQARIEDRGQRLKNIVGSFAIKGNQKNNERIKGRNIILIDDVTTTGATLNEAKKVLKHAGAKKVIAFTVAH